MNRALFFAIGLLSISFLEPCRAALGQVGCSAKGNLNLSATPARIGHPLSFTIEGPPNAPVALFGSFLLSTTDTPIGQICVSGAPAARFRVFLNGLADSDPTLDSAGRFTLTRPIPDRCSLLGTTFYVQAAARIGKQNLLSNSLSVIVGSSGSHSLLNRMTQERGLHSVTSLQDGNVLITGGGSGSIVAPRASNTADLYFHQFKEVRAVPNLMTVERAVHATALLPNGKVLICGGLDTSQTVHSSAEEYDPVTMTFSAVGSMTSRRAGHTACPIPGGILIVGGTSEFSDPNSANSNALPTAEIYNPSTQTFSLVLDQLREPRLFHTSTLLQDGTVLIAGGIKGFPAVLAEEGVLFDPTTQLWSSAGTMRRRRALHGAQLLQDGRVLLAGGIQFLFGTQRSAELYTPGSGFALTGRLPESKAGVKMTTLPNGRVLEAGGISTFLNPTGTASASVFCPETGFFVSTGQLSVPRGAQEIASLPDGSVLTLGGATDSSTVHDTLDRYYP